MIFLWFIGLFFQNTSLGYLCQTHYISVLLFVLMGAPFSGSLFEIKTPYLVLLSMPGHLALLRISFARDACFGVTTMASLLLQVYFSWFFGGSWLVTKTVNCGANNSCERLCLLVIEVVFLREHGYAVGDHRIVWLFFLRGEKSSHSSYIASACFRNSSALLISSSALDSRSFFLSLWASVFMPVMRSNIAASNSGNERT